VSRLAATIAAAIRDARRAEALLREPGGRRAISSDPERLLALFELRSHGALDQFGDRERRVAHRERNVAVRERRRSAAAGLGGD
jgi:hypothetical protein